jgi:hypothetical protein
MRGKGSPVLEFPQTSRVLDGLEDYCLFRRHSEYFLDSSSCFILLWGPETDTPLVEYCRIGGGSAYEDCDYPSSTTSDEFIFVGCAKSQDRRIRLKHELWLNGIDATKHQKLFLRRWRGVRELIDRGGYARLRPALSNFILLYLIIRLLCS